MNNKDVYDMSHLTDNSNSIIPPSGLEMRAPYGSPHNPTDNCCLHRSQNALPDDVQIQVIPNIFKNPHNILSKKERLKQNKSALVLKIERSKSTLFRQRPRLLFRPHATLRFLPYRFQRMKKVMTKMLFSFSVLFIRFYF